MKSLLLILPCPKLFGEDSNHAWGGAAICLLAQALCGIEVKESGCRRFVFSPLEDGLDWADMTLPTPLGALHYAFRRHIDQSIPKPQLEKWTHDLMVPVGVSIELQLPGMASEVSVNRQHWQRGHSCPFTNLLIENSPENIKLKLNEGQWRIEALLSRL